MLSPQEIRNKTFDKTLGKGYRADAVDAFLQEVASSMASVLQEKQVLEEKMGVLAEKLEEYRDDEESLRSALLSAQKLGDSVIRESKNKAEIIMRDATIKAERMIENAQRNIEKEQFALTKIQKDVATFKNRLLTLYKQHIELITALPEPEEKEPEPAPAPVAAPVQATEAEPVQAVEEQAVSQPAAAQTKESSFQFEYEEVPDREEETVGAKPVKSESRFGPLKFGAGYDLKRENEGNSKKKR